MGGQVLLINPSRRKGSGGSRKPRSAAQRAATKKLVALNRTHRTSNPSRRRRSYRAASRSTSVMHSIRRHRKTRRRNPISIPHMGAIGNTLKTAAFGAVGGIAVDALMTYLPLPASLITRTDATGRTNYMYYATKAAIALGIGSFGRKILGSHASQLAEGALVVNIYDLMRTLMTGAGMTLGYYNPGMVVRGMGAYTNNAAAPVKQLGAYQKAGGLNDYTRAGGLDAYTNKSSGMGSYAAADRGRYGR